MLKYAFATVATERRYRYLKSRVARMGREQQLEHVDAMIAARLRLWGCS